MGMLISSFCKMDRVDVAESIISNEMSKINLIPDLRILDVLVSSYGKKGELEKALKLLEEMKKTYDISPGKNTYLTLISLLAQNGEFETAIDILEKQRDANQKENISLNLNEEAKKTYIAGFNRILQGLQSRIGPDSKEEIVFSNINSLLEHMSSRNVRPNKATFSTVI